jgi:hypothetical protein
MGYIIQACFEEIIQSQLFVNFLEPNSLHACTIFDVGQKLVIITSPIA